MHINNYRRFDDYIISNALQAKELYTHEYGHTIQSKRWGPLYLPVPALLSIWNCRDNARIDHNHFWVETRANSRLNGYMKKHYPDYTLSSSLILYTKP